jgi:hypothetical protein
MEQVRNENRFFVQAGAHAWLPVVVHLQSRHLDAFRAGDAALFRAVCETVRREWRRLVGEFRAGGAAKRARGGAAAARGDGEGGAAAEGGGEAEEEDGEEEEGEPARARPDAVAERVRLFRAREFIFSFELVETQPRFALLAADAGDAPPAVLPPTAESLVVRAFPAACLPELVPPAASADARRITKFLQSE